MKLKRLLITIAALFIALVFIGNSVAYNSAIGFSQAPTAATVSYVDYNAADQGASGAASPNTIKAFVDAIGSDNGTIVLRHNSGNATTPYTLTTSETIPANITLEVERGAVIALGASATLTIYSPENLDVLPDQQIVSGTGLLRFTTPGDIYLGWFGAVGDDPGDGSGTNDAVALLAAIDCARATYANNNGSTLLGIPGRTYLSESALFVGGNT